MAFWIPLAACVLTAKVTDFGVRLNRRIALIMTCVVLIADLYVTLK